MVDDLLWDFATASPVPKYFDSHEEYIEYLRDPRREFQKDSELWQELLTRALKIDEDLFLSLHCLRCGGAKLTMHSGKKPLQPRYIDPDEEPERGTAWQCYEDWNFDCKDLLGDHKSELRELLNRFRKSKNISQEELSI